MRQFEFDSRINMKGKMPIFPAEAIKDEPMFWSCDLNFAKEHAGPITKSFLENLPMDWKDTTHGLILDSRVHMLMEGFWPCIPGWHLDDVPRQRIDHQPEHFTPDYKSEHLLCFIGEESRTEFALGKGTLIEPAIGETIYGAWDPQIEQMCQENKLERLTAIGGIMYEFNWQTWHRGMRSTGQGWRWFARISRKTKRPVMNEIRRQTQVYMETINAGW